MTGLELLLVALAAVGGGLVNALAGGGTLITFPALLAIGLPAVSANVTSTVALCPGYFGATLAQWKDIREQPRRLLFFVPAGIVGGLIGGFLLLNTGERLFRELVPFLILLASALLALQDPVRKWLVRRQAVGKNPALPVEAGAVLPVVMASAYGGYFGAGLSVIILAVLGLTIDDNLTRLNGLKQAIAFGTNTAAAVLFVFSGQVVWLAALVMAFGALFGGVLGGKLAGRIKPSVLRWVVVTIGVIVGIIYLVR
jgi:uncharacterized protein